VSFFSFCQGEAGRQVVIPIRIQALTFVGYTAWLLTVLPCTASSPFACLFGDKLNANWNQEGEIPPFLVSY